MSTHLSAVDRIFLTHTLFDEGVPRFRHHRNAASFSHNIDGIPGQSRVMDDLRAWFFL